MSVFRGVTAVNVTVSEGHLEERLLVSSHGRLAFLLDAYSRSPWCRRLTNSITTNETTGGLTYGDGAGGTQLITLEHTRRGASGRLLEPERRIRVSCLVWAGTVDASKISHTAPQIPIFAHGKTSRQIAC